ncbi:hypothetical protein OSB04_017750 [Centaurea solstitialis]|uniref:Integrase catalytic domain-containing protein n=1 Tax=Centaurea solstitialis TaxID=347529 RepID=A0AA38TFC0_9ASTR|nr:hypothetical protein OSB04_017750 [Centaurea solstitialis]
MGDDAKPNESVVPGIISYCVILKIPVKLNSTNWAQWSMFVQTGLESLDKDAYLTKDPPNPKTREWKLDDSGIRMALCNAMEPQILTIAQNYPTTKKMREHLQSSFSAKESLSHTYSVFGSYFRCEQGDSDLTEYYTRLSKLAEELRVLFPVTLDVKVQEERLAKMDVMTCISGLSPKYSSARPLLLSHTASKSLASTYHLAREMYSDSSTAQPSPGTDASALTFSARNNEYGHIKYNCPNRPPGSHPPPRLPRARVASTNATTDVYPEASGQVASTPRANTAHAGISSTCLSACSSSWIVDSGATYHMTENKNLIVNLDTSTTHNPVRLADGSSCPIVGKGSTSNLPNLNVSSVLYVPTFPDSLISVSRITKKHNCKELGTNRLIGTGFESQGLYRLPALQSPSTHLCESSIREVHCQLGHPSLSVLKQLRPEFSPCPKFVCESCELGKHTRRPYPPKESKCVSTLFQLIHSDVWGPCPVTSINGFKYFITFVDDYSRATWVYLFKSRNEIFSIFREFYAYVQTQFDISLKTLRSDNAKEYFSSDFMSFYLSMGSPFPLAPKIFGCVCYVHDHRPGHNKLDPRAIKCVFLGYSRVQRLIVATVQPFVDILQAPIPTSSSESSYPIPDPSETPDPPIYTTPLQTSNTPTHDLDADTRFTKVYVRQRRQATINQENSTPCHDTGDFHVPQPTSEPHLEHFSEPHPDPAPQSENEPNTDPAPQSENEPNTDLVPQSENEPNTEPYDPPGAPLPEIPIAF